ncbi:corticotropin-releasing factor receptor 1-like isoform X2 [Dendronephthya gigantea]|uniref:corticotropin-releasing factor receptor 1-like isoform X2 n=1 Tax=Dendronephthya gigantea TaxID=151771 RepID=UPI001068FBCA|nr:corticotropin-releasing factor receptor 1-like isoform X2 [Dendronephthya gigantea]
MLSIFLALLLQINILIHVEAQEDFAKELKKQELECYNNPKNRLIKDGYPVKFTCGVSFYGACWPTTRANSTVYLQCPSIFFDLLTSGNISRRCNESGFWGKPDISFCKKISSVPLPNEEEDEKQRIYVVLSWFSFSIMIPSLVVTLYLLKGKNERFNVHTNLILAFTFRISTFFIHHYGNLGNQDSSRVSCNLVWILNRYFASAEIMWMLNEALLLLRKVVVIFDKKSYFKYYLLIGWGSPLLLLTAYIPIIVYFVDHSPKKCWVHYKDSIYMLVLYVPLVFFLIVDFFALIYTVSIFVKRQQRQQKGDFVKVRKAIKGTLVLSPLLGVIYLLIFFVPKNPPVWYQYFLRIVYPMQGTLACLVYITFSGELLNKAKSKCRSSLQGTRILENVRILVEF